MRTIDRASGTYLYRQVTELIAGQIDAGALKPGDRLPSLRRLSERLALSIPTVKQGYLELERQGRVESRPQSGFYVRALPVNPIVRPGARAGRPTPVRNRRLIDRVYEAINQPGNVPFGIANPSMARPAAKGLHRAMKRVMARAEERSLGYAPDTGEPALRRQIAYHYLELGGEVDPDEIIITNGAQEALTLALMCIAEPGDAIAVESPTYFGLLQIIESLGMLAIEIDTCPEAGVSLEHLEEVLERHEVKGCMFASALNNPMGSLTSEAHRDALVAMLEKRGIPLVEDDVYGDLLFDGYDRTPALFRARRNLVMSCGSYSKTVAPGYRVGWLVPARFGEQARRLKRAVSCSSGMLPQLTLCEFIAGGEYERHLRALRATLMRNCERMTAAIAQHFPATTRVSQPRGGSVLWLELERGTDVPALFEAALASGISTCPGPVCSPTGRYGNYLRLSFGHPWSERTEAAIRTLGQLVSEPAR